jgi:LacI family transcriptional regulator
LHCIGQNNVAAGRVAASLIGKFTAGLSGSVGIIAGAMTLCDQADRRVGFEQVITREYPHLRVLPVREGRDDSSITVTVARELLANNPDLVGLYNIGAGNRGLINAIEESGRKSEVVVVAHELTEHARRALIAGTFDAIINQNLLHEIEYAVQTLKAFSDSDAGFIAPSVSIDIFVRDNLP